MMPNCELLIEMQHRQKNSIDQSKD
uniref:DNA topoisomerase 1-like n=1 Tax=Rhizophora mucronata TaxID=61149 RepID=A0A2P2LZ70_RHIMU